MAQHFKNNPNYSDTNNVLNVQLFDDAYNSIKNWQEYTPTPLHQLPALAAELGLGEIYYKDEAHRFGLKSFKALGGAYAVVHVLKEHLSVLLSDNTITDQDILSGKYSEHLKDFTVATATDGNHGRSVAWGAKQCGINCMIYMHKGVSKSRAIAVELLGAKVEWVDGNYDDSLLKTKRDAIENEWHIISDTSYDGYTYVPKYVMAGYTVMTREMENQLPDSKIPSHIIIQGGVGGLAGAICAHASKIWGDKRPRFIVVEPETADCLLQSAIKGRPKMVHIDTETMMGGLSCGEVSTIGWDILKDNADDFTSISDENVATSMCLLALGMGDDPKIEAGESGVAGLALLLELKDNPALKADLGLDENSQVLLFGTEGATDQEIYNKIISGG
ncbi:MAG: diaminopropionate ammonia-lyase [Kordiimonadaceae bacterium]|nr:diaminopropionate ammonia-lyase [Kordiimonadaceae bacterium]MBT7583588.1 diaminopropionate ammonia-lyase [Kordiimonadaceae bacterium]